MDIKGFFRRNRLYLALLFFLLSINAVAFYSIHSGADRGSYQNEATSVSQHSQERPVSSQQTVEQRRENILALMEDDPVLYGFIVFFNFFLLLIFLTGLGLDIYFLRRYAAKSPPCIRTVPESEPSWGPADILKVTILFIFFGYLFVMAQSFLAGFFDIFDNDNFRMVFNTSVVNVAGIGVIWFFVTRKYSQSPEVMGITRRKWLRNIGYGMVAYLAIIPILGAVMLITQYITQLVDYEVPVQPIVRVLIEEEKPPVLLFSTLFAAVFGPVAEEIFFRGFVYSALKKKIGVFWSIFSTAAVFAVLHAHLVGLVPIFVLGVLLAYLFEKTGSLVAPIAVHIAHNLAMLVLVFLLRSVSF